MGVFSVWLLSCNVFEVHPRWSMGCSNSLVHILWRWGVIWEGLGSGRGVMVGEYYRLSKPDTPLLSEDGKWFTNGALFIQPSAVQRPVWHTG